MTKRKKMMKKKKVTEEERSLCTPLYSGHLCAVFPYKMNLSIVEPLPLWTLVDNGPKNVHNIVIVQIVSTHQKSSKNISASPTYKLLPPLSPPL